MKTLSAMVLIFASLSLEARTPVRGPNADVEAEAPFDAQRWNALNGRWMNEVVTKLKAGEEPKEMFKLAEEILLMNPAVLETLASDLSAIIKTNPKLAKKIEAQWIAGKFTKNKTFWHQSDTEDLMKMAKRLASRGNGSVRQ